MSAATMDAARAELRRALDRAGAMFAELPEPDRPDPIAAAWLEHDRAVDRAVASGDPEAALAAVAAWERFAREQLAPPLAGGAR